MCPEQPCVSGCPVNIAIPDFIQKITDRKIVEFDRQRCDYMASQLSAETLVLHELGEHRAGGWLDRALPQIGAMVSRLIRTEDTAARLSAKNRCADWWRAASRAASSVAAVNTCSRSVRMLEASRATSAASASRSSCPSCAR